MPIHSGLLGIAIFFAGVILATYGIIVRSRRRRQRTVGQLAQARVVDNVAERHLTGRRLWVPLVEFEVGASRHRFALSSAGARRRWPLGSTFEVLYDPAHPNRAGTAEQAGQFPLALLFGLLLIGGYLALTA